MLHIELAQHVYVYISKKKKKQNHVHDNFCPLSITIMALYHIECDTVMKLSIALLAHLIWFFPRTRLRLKLIIFCTLSFSPTFAMCMWLCVYEWQAILKRRRAIGSSDTSKRLFSFLCGAVNLNYFSNVHTFTHRKNEW